MKIGRLTLLYSGFKNTNTKTNIKTWQCLCDCGNECNVLELDLINNSTNSCGCLQKERTSEANKKYNKYDLSGDYGIGYTYNIDPTDICHKRNYFYFDLEDYKKIKKYCWCFNNNGYLISNLWDSNKKKNYKLLLHKIILDISKTKKIHIDHIHHNKFDNRKKELRICTPQQNGQNCVISKNNTSGVKGVSYNKRAKKWISYIRYDNSTLHLGYFDTFEEAVKARKEAEDKYFGEYSYDNSMNMNTENKEAVDI